MSDDDKDGWESALSGQPCVLCAAKGELIDKLQAEIERLRGDSKRLEKVLTHGVWMNKDDSWLWNREDIDTRLPDLDEEAGCD